MSRGRVGKVSVKCLQKGNIHDNVRTTWQVKNETEAIALFKVLISLSELQLNVHK